MTTNSNVVEFEGAPDWRTVFCSMIIRTLLRIDPDALTKEEIFELLHLLRRIEQDIENRRDLKPTAAVRTFRSKGGDQ
jgi:hypothetical protein